MTTTSPSAIGNSILTSLGVGSGLNISSIVSALVQAEGQPQLTALSNKQSADQTRLSALGTLKSALSDFQTSVQQLTDGSVFQSYQATSSNQSLATVTAGTGAVGGNYTMEVQQLAQAQKLISTGFASSSTVVGTGTLNISVGGKSFSVDINSSNNTLQGISDAINGAANNTGVNATIVNVDNGSGGTVSKLLLTSRDTGTANQITVTANDSDGNNTDMSGLSQLVYDPSGSGTTNLSQQTAAQDAIIQVDGQTATRSSNTINDVISGLTINLNAASPGTTFNVDVTQNTQAETNAAQGFVTAYNKLQSTINSLQSYDASTSTAGALLGDPTLNAIQETIRQETSAVVSSAGGNYNSLAMIGITIDQTGTMSLDTTTFNQALQMGPNVVGNVFSSTNGVAEQLNNSLTQYLQTGGILDSQVTSLNQDLNNITKQNAAVQSQLSNYQTMLQNEFSAMESTVAQFQSTGAYLSQQFSTSSGSSSGG